MRDKCAGSARVPVEGSIEARGDHRIGQCPVCGAWISLLSNGTLHRHVNWHLRRHAEYLDRERER